MSTGFLIFLLVDMFIAGIIATLAVQHAKAHYRPEKHSAEKPHISTATRERMLHESEAQYQKVLDQSVNALQKDLETNGKQINGLITQFAGVIVEDEMKRYHAELANLQKQAQADLGGIREAVAGHQKEIEAQVAAELQKEKQFLVSQIDTKLGDAVGSFLVETLQHNVDLGSQADYLVAMLEEHKSDFIKEVADEAPTGK